MMSKNPFEIRSDMLQLAKEYMDQQQYQNLEFSKKMYDQGKLQMEEWQKASQMYSMEDLMEKAKEMYSFVSKKD
tara:strand:- start:28296 stop:28517 length:222 start_codon:yes stop_codon:yes gene_type:complete